MTEDNVFTIIITAMLIGMPVAICMLASSMTKLRMKHYYSYDVRIELSGGKVFYLVERHTYNRGLRLTKIMGAYSTKTDAEDIAKNLNKNFAAFGSLGS